MVKKHLKINGPKTRRDTDQLAHSVIFIIIAAATAAAICALLRLVDVDRQAGRVVSITTASPSSPLRLLHWSTEQQQQQAMANQIL